MCVFISVVVLRTSAATDYFHLGGSDLTITVYRACVQDFANGGADTGDLQIQNTEDTLPEPLQQKLFGESELFHK